MTLGQQLKDAGLTECQVQVVCSELGVLPTARAYEACERPGYYVLDFLKTLGLHQAAGALEGTLTLSSDTELKIAA